jgi:type II secretory pathway predicted ATPase ExeA
VLPHLDAAQTSSYIQCHLDYAGCDHELFTDKAIDEIYRCSTGTMRIINRICEKSLMYACQQRKKLIDDHAVRYVIEHEMLGGERL